MKESKWPCKIKHAYVFWFIKAQYDFLWWIYGLICVAATNFDGFKDFQYTEIG